MRQVPPISFCNCHTCQGLSKFQGILKVSVFWQTGCVSERARAVLPKLVQPGAPQGARLALCLQVLLTCGWVKQTLPPPSGVGAEGRRTSRTCSTLAFLHTPSPTSPGYYVYQFAGGRDGRASLDRSAAFAQTCTALQSRERAEGERLEWSARACRSVCWYALLSKPCKLIRFSHHQRAPAA